MGFPLNLLIAHPHHTTVHENPRDTSSASKDYTLWQIDGVIEIGRVTRLEKITNPRFSHLTWAGKERAGICMVSGIMQKIMAKLNKATRKDFAPAFLLVEDGTSYYQWKQDHLVFGELEGGEELIEPLHGGQLLPREDYLHKHNEAMELSPTELAGYLHDRNSYMIVYDAPFLWESCEVVADWIFEMETSGSESWKELIKDEVSLAYVLAWRAYLKEIAKTGAKVLLFFDHVSLPSLV